MHLKYTHLEMAFSLYDNHIAPITITDTTGRPNVRIQNLYTCTTCCWRELWRGGCYSAPRHTRFRNPLDLTGISDSRLDFQISIWIMDSKVDFWTSNEFLLFVIVKIQLKCPHKRPMKPRNFQADYWTISRLCSIITGKVLGVWLSYTSIV